MACPFPRFEPNRTPLEPPKEEASAALPSTILEGSFKVDWTRFRSAIHEAWDGINQEVIDHLICSMPLLVIRRLEQVFRRRIEITLCFQI